MSGAVMVWDAAGVLTPRHQRALALHLGKPVVLEAWDPARLPPERLGCGMLAVTRHQVAGAMTAEDALAALCRHSERRSCAVGLHAVVEGAACAPI